MAKKLEAVWMGEAIKHAAGGQLNAQLKKAAVQFVDLYASIKWILPTKKSSPKFFVRLSTKASQPGK